MGIYQGSDEKVRVVLGGEEVEASVIDGRMHFEGDIIVPPQEADDAGGRSGRALFGRSVRLWPKGIIPYAIDDEMARVSLRIVRSAIQHWERKTDIRFVERTNEKSYVIFQKGAGCASSVGQIGRRQFITVGAGCGTPQTVHEIGHCVGMWHEQSRPDRDEHVEIFDDEIQSGQKANFKLHGHDKMVGPYDLKSVMHYESLAFAKRGRPTILTRDGKRIGNRGTLSDGDVAAVQELYAEEFEIRAREEAAEPEVEDPGTGTETGTEAGTETETDAETETETGKDPLPEVETGDEDPPVPSPEMFFHGGRFKAQVIWKTKEGKTGLGYAVPGVSEQSGLFWFFGRENWELLVKVLDGTAINEHWWVYVAAATDVEWKLQIEDTATDKVWTTSNPQGKRASVAETEAFKGPAGGPLPPLADADAPPIPEMLFHDGRFKAEVTWKTADGKTGRGSVVPGSSQQSGLFWFFGRENWELVVKLLDGAAINKHWWVYVAAATDVEWKLQIEDSKTGKVWKHTNPLGKRASIAEIEAFDA